MSEFIERRGKSQIYYVTVGGRSKEIITDRHKGVGGQKKPQIEFYVTVERFLVYQITTVYMEN